jgi:hypothetical protein
MSRLLIVVVAGLALLSASCARGKSGGRAGQLVQADSIYIETLNDNFYEARIHAVYEGGQRRSLGTIAGNGGRSRTAIPWEPRALKFEVLFIIGGSAYVSYPVDVSSGESIEVRLPPNIDQSGFFRRVSRS